MTRDASAHAIAWLYATPARRVPSQNALMARVQPFPSSESLREGQAVTHLLRARHMRVAEFIPFLWRCMYDDEPVEKDV